MLPHQTPPDASFDNNEQLYRRIESGHVYDVNGSSKVNNLAVKLPGCSFHRSKYSTALDAIVPALQPEATGVAAIRIADIPGPFLPPPENKDGKIHELYVEHTPCFCEDPPLDLYPHSEMFVRRQGTKDRSDYWPNSSRLRKEIRDDIANQMTVEIHPVNPAKG